MTRPEQCGWHTSVPIVGKYAHVHITKASFRDFKGYYWWLTPPRIGIDFRVRKGERGREWIPNIDIADLVRLIRILQFLKRDGDAKLVASKKRFYLAPSFDRRIRIKPNSTKGIVMDYRDRGWQDYGNRVEIDRQQIEPLIDALEMAYSRFMRLVKSWHDSTKLPAEFRHEL